MECQVFLDSQKNKVLRLKEKIEARKTEAKNLEEELSQIETKFKNIESEREREKQISGDLSAYTKDLLTGMSETRNEFSDLKNLFSESFGKISSTQPVLDQLVQGNQVKKQSIHDLNISLVLASNQLDDLSNTLKQKSSDFSALIADIKEAENNLKIKERELERSVNSLNTLSSELKKKEDLLLQYENTSSPPITLTKENTKSLLNYKIQKKTKPETSEPEPRELDLVQIKPDHDKSSILQAEKNRLVIERDKLKNDLKKIETLNLQHRSIQNSSEEQAKKDSFNSFLLFTAVCILYLYFIYY